MIFALLSIGSTAYAQLTTGTLSGSVRDGQGAAVVGATASLLCQTEIQNFHKSVGTNHNVFRLNVSMS